MVPLRPNNAAGVVTPLLLACAKGHLETAKALISRSGAHLANFRDDLLESALHKSTYRDSAETFEYIHGLIPNATSEWNDEGQSPLHLAAGKTGAVKVIKFAAEELNVDFSVHLNNKGGHVLNDAAFYASLEVIKYLLSLDVGRKLSRQGDNAGYTPIHVAAINGKVESCKLLLQSGLTNVNASAAGGQGSTPLYLAIRNNHVATALFLVRNGADVNAFVGVSVQY